MRRALTRDVTETGEGDVDQEIASTAPLEEDSQRGEDDGKDELEDIGAGKSHGCRRVVVLWERERNVMFL